MVITVAFPHSGHLAKSRHAGSISATIVCNGNFRSLHESCTCRLFSVPTIEATEEILPRTFTEHFPANGEVFGDRRGPPAGRAIHHARLGVTIAPPVIVSRCPYFWRRRVRGAGLLCKRHRAACVRNFSRPGAIVPYTPELPRAPFLVGLLPRPGSADSHRTCARQKKHAGNSGRTWQSYWNPQFSSRGDYH